MLTVFPCLDMSSIAHWFADHRHVSVWQAVSFPANRTLCNVFHRPDGTLRAPLFGLQGGGVHVDRDGVANFESCNIHDNTAGYVCLHL